MITAFLGGQDDKMMAHPSFLAETRSPELESWNEEREAGQFLPTK